MQDRRLFGTTIYKCRRTFLRLHLRFPEVAPPEPLYYQLNANENRVFSHTVERLTRDFTYARYSPLAYYQGERAEADARAVVQWILDGTLQ